MGRIKFLNRWLNGNRLSRRRMSLFRRRMPSRTYEILMDRSGLSDGCLAMLVRGVENESVSFIGQIAKGEAHWKIHCRGPWS